MISNKPHFLSYIALVEKYNKFKGTNSIIIQHFKFTEEDELHLRTFRGFSNILHV